MSVFLSIATTGFVVAFLHSAIPTHWLPFVAAARVQKWSRAKTLLVTAFAGTGHVLLTTILGVLVVWLGLEVDKKVGEIFPLLAGGVLILLGLYYLKKQAKGGGHAHHHLFGGHGHSHSNINDDVVRGSHGGLMVNSGHGIVEVSIFETGTPPCFRLYFYDENKNATLPQADEVVTVSTVRADGKSQTYEFLTKGEYLESTSEIPEPHEFDVSLTVKHGGHAHSYGLRFVEDHHHGDSHCSTELHSHRACEDPASLPGESVPVRSDRVVILGLFALLTFSPCEGFLPVYLSGIRYGWGGFLLLSLVLAVATVAGMILFTWLTLLGLQKLKLDRLEKYESGLLGGVLVLLGILVILFEH